MAPGEEGEFNAPGLQVCERWASDGLVWGAALSLRSGSCGVSAEGRHREEAARYTPGASGVAQCETAWVCTCVYVLTLAFGVGGGAPIHRRLPLRSVPADAGAAACGGAAAHTGSISGPVSRRPAFPGPCDRAPPAGTPVTVPHAARTAPTPLSRTRAHARLPGRPTPVSSRLPETPGESCAVLCHRVW